MLKYIKAALAPNLEPELPPNYFESIAAARKLSFTSSSDGSVKVEFDPLVASAWELSEAHLRQIKQHNRRGRQLRALISVGPKKELLKTARKLDDERARGKVRGPLHGLPVVLKDNIMTDADLGMDTTVGKHPQPSLKSLLIFS
jgi:amidase